MSKSKKTNNVTAKMYDTLVRPVITEKSMISSENGKEKIFRGHIGQRSDYKKAVVTLAEGQNIDVTTGI